MIDKAVVTPLEKLHKNATPSPPTKEDGPFRFTYLAVIAVPGMRISEDSSVHTQFCAFPDLKAEAFLTQDWDTYCLHMDRSNAFAYLMLAAFRGRGRFGRLSANWHRLLVRLLGGQRMFRSRLKRETIAAHERRHKHHKSPGCYLVYHADGDVIEPVRLRFTRRFGDIGFCIDAFSSEPYREVHRRALHSSATALSLALVDTNGSPETHFIGDIIYLTGKGGLKLYSITIENGAVGIVTSAPPGSESLFEANRYIPAMINDSRLETAISLFVQSQKKENDNLRSFIAAWSALELVVNRLAKVIWPKWKSLLEADGLPEWDKEMKDVVLQDYRMRDRFFSVACVLDMGSARADTETFIRINDMRSGFYHRMTVQERDLPTNDARALFRKYLKLGLSVQYDDQNEAIK